ncbi:hypothetical protein Ppa06_63100 [Planomonospora parontospora subsp. parontospora]|uniref:Uncharacterized protein n=2 Tax=Planomonospora parontospora TaxID=58119 RepID=A0AA37F7P8_9ACTN|nr:hypothetical protein GCM10010126_63040 [Planomonospora parontospora]GII12512.1 hypothetical protein Ppa06_63100 [Planomonospora parontospora subsp. parontospora]
MSRAQPNGPPAGHRETPGPPVRGRDADRTGDAGPVETAAARTDRFRQAGRPVPEHTLRLMGNGHGLTTTNRSSPDMTGDID